MLSSCFVGREESIKAELVGAILWNGWKRSPVDAGRKLNVHKTRLLNVLCAFNLRPLFKGQ